MAGFTFSMDMDKLFPKGIGDGTLAFDMVKAGQEVLYKAIKEGASKHIVTGDMVKSIKKWKPTIDKRGDVVGKIRFEGSSGASKYKPRKVNKRFDRTNWIKAFRIEYGTSRQRAQPFVRPAIKRSENEVREAMMKVYERGMKG